MAPTRWLRRYSCPCNSGKIVYWLDYSFNNVFNVSANAGDCRAVLSVDGIVRPISRDLTPATERKRLQSIAYSCPEYLGGYYSRLEYSRHLTRNDLKKKVFYRDWFMDGWACKTVKQEDLKPPMISDCFKKVINIFTKRKL